MTQTADNYGRVLYRMGISKEVAEETKRLFFLTGALQKMLENPLVSLKEKHRLIERIFPKEVQNFLKVLCKHKHLNLLKDIFQAYEMEYEKEYHILHVYLFYVTPLTEEQRAGMEEYLKKKYEAEEIVFEERQQADLLGGFVLRIGDIEEDWSMKGRLNRLEQRLIWR